MDPIVYADLRCLQDPMYQFRGVGHHVSCLLQQRLEGPCAAWKLVGLVDDAFGELPPKYAALVDEVSRVWNPAITKRGAVFIDSSPMTHSPHLTTRFIANPKFLNAVVIYDFIPLDREGYLPTPASRIDYLSTVVRLRNFDLYFPISEYSAWRLAEVVGVSPTKTFVTGASVRKSIYDLSRKRPIRHSPYANAHPYFFTLGGGDRRKNTETAVAAVRELNDRYRRRIPLKVVGHYGPEYKADLIRISGHPEGAGFLELCPGIDDETLVDFYRGAVATICPSHIEGFDLPIVESAVCGTPVLASTCGAHMELVKQTEALFPSNDHQSLAALLDRILHDSAWREKLTGEQAPIAGKFHEEQVGAKFWNAIDDAMLARAGRTGNTRAKPKVAFLSPYPPEQSGVARYTQLTIEAAAPSFNVDLYTDAPRPFADNGSFHDAGRIGAAALLKSDYDSIISVIGNSHFHIPIFEFLEQYGGPVILHDSRLTHIYHFRMGPERFREFAGSLLGYSVTAEEVGVWLADRDVPSLFVEPVLKRAKPLIVHTAQYQALLRERYGVEAEVATFCPNMTFTDEELTSASRAAARRRLGMADDAFVISTFGYVARVKGMEACIIAAEMLRGWNLPAELHFVGSTIGLETDIERVVNQYGISAHVHWSTKFVDTETYRDFMLASDAAIQLRQYGFGQPSAALTDCISAALPCVATSDLARSCDSPDYVLSVPAISSPLQIAEQLATIWEARKNRSPNPESRRQYLSTHNFEYYVRRLREILDI